MMEKHYPPPEDEPTDEPESAPKPEPIPDGEELPLAA